MCLIFLAVPLQGFCFSAQSAVVLEQSTRRILFESNAYQQMGMASTTKIMTAVVTLEHAAPDEMVTVGENAVGVEGSSMWLELGERITVEDLLYGLLLNSGNDAAVALAEYVGGSVEAFCEMMNRKAEAIGARQTHFVNPNGLAEEGHYTTAYDLGLIACYALENETFREIVSTTEKSVSWNKRSYDRKLSNHNKMLRMYEGCDGVKTGFTKSTGRALVTSATRDGMQVVAVTLNAPDDWNDHRMLLDQAFADYRTVRVFPKGGFVRSIPVLGGKKDAAGIMTEVGLAFVCSKEDQPEYQLQVQLPDHLTAPVKRGDKVGYGAVLVNGEIVAQSDLYAADTVETAPGKHFMESLREMLVLWAVT